jgi:glycosyltransferase involved in cell wall biosynthesis
MTGMLTSTQHSRIVCVHLVDDFSGSSNIFAQVLGAARDAGLDTEVLVGSLGSAGFIRSRFAVRTLRYSFPANRWLRLLSFADVQLRMFLAVARLCVSRDVGTVYASTVLPAGAVLAGALFGKRVVVHLHEVGLGSRALFSLLKSVAIFGSDRIICVSRYVAQTLKLPATKVNVVYNSLTPEDWALAGRIASGRDATHDSAPFQVVMACSLRGYKGVDSFVALARLAHERGIDGGRPIRFELLLNCEPDELTAFTTGTALPPNLAIVRRPSSVFDHYRQAHLLMNLSHREGWIETFGMTLLEAMACAVPVVCPLQGGCVELFEPARGGWRIDSRDLDGLSALIDRLSTNPPQWWAASRQALEAAQRFSPQHFSQVIPHLLVTP